MKTDVYNFKKEVVESIDLDDEVFGLIPRSDILARVIHWQLAKRRGGNHQVREIGAVSGSTKKIYRQKGTGGARHGSKRGAQFRGGGIIFGPHVRDHGYSLPKKIRRLGMRMALSERFNSNRVIIMDHLTLDSGKTRDAQSIFAHFEHSNILLIDQFEVDINLAHGISNLHHIDALPQIGANVYDIMRKDLILISKDAVQTLQGRLK